jgi:elongator complex protein 5
LKEVVTLLDDNILYNPPMERDPGAENEEPTSTFELGLTDKQRRDREGVVLPYFDAQSGDGPGEGGRILYDMGEEDDFDEEEDEI